MSSMVGNNTGQFGQATGKAQKVGGGYKAQTFQQFTPEQMNLFQQMFGQVGPDSYLGKLAGGDQSSFAQLEAPALQQFNGLQGNLASRFSGMGGTGARNSSGFYNSANTAAQDFASQLQSQRMGIQDNARKQLFEMSSNLLGQRPYEQHFFEQQQKEPSFLEKLLGALGGAGAQLGGAYGTKKLGIYG